MRRPLLVTIISILSFLWGLFQIAIAAALLAKRNDQAFLDDARATTSEVTTLAIVMLVIGLLMLLVSIGLWTGSRFARALTALVALGQIIGGIYTIIKLDSSEQATGIGMILGSVVLLYFLFGTEKAKRFFT
jgi:uncharacterized membrane protein (DUF2068 family)